MSDAVIRVENLGKRYRIGERERYVALRDVLTRAASAPARWLRSRQNSAPNADDSHIWALKDASFDICQGEVVGIIGRNGAGKSTLLKILARVTKPSRGSAEVRGRMGTLLEVGTGFHPELTGRENVVLSGAILGMGKGEIRRKFDEIVAFAEVEKFIDTPLKHFSTGMLMRLAFAVAAHLEPEILVVDEVLAVGDLDFQRKCLGKMGDVAKTGRTILFVSHQMNQVRRLCDRVLLLEGGQIKEDGRTKTVVNRYELSCLESGPGRNGASGPIVFIGWQVGEDENNVLDLDQLMDRIVVRIEIRADKAIRKGKYVIGLRDINNVMVWSDMFDGISLDPGPAVLLHEFRHLPLTPGLYTWEVRLHDGDHWHDHSLMPVMSLTSKTDSRVYDHLKGFLHLDSKFGIQRAC